MRFLDSNHWTNKSNLEGLLFFAQMVDEMLFDFTLDSYKPLALNSRLLCIETLETIEEIKNGFVPKKNLQSVLEELKWSLSNDIAVKKILGNKFDNYFNKIKPNDIKIKQVENTIRFLYNRMDDRKYLSRIKECLSEVVNQGKNKEDIRSLTNSFLTELINYGYNPNHIYYQNVNFFFNKTKRIQISETKEILEFFNIFNFEMQTFNIVFIGGIIFREFKDTLNQFNIVVTRNYNCYSKMPEDIAFKRSRANNESFVICSERKALDHHSARESAESLIGEIRSIFNFYHHKEKPEILDKCIVQRNEDNYVVIIEKPTKAVLKTKTDKSALEAAKSVQSALRKIRFSPESTHRFARSLDLHSAALSSNTLENQLLDFWAALETLLPKDIESNKDRIVQICDSLIPFLQINYITKQLKELYSDLLKWDNEKTISVISKIPNSDSYTDLEKITSLTALDSNKKLRIELYSLLNEDYPLLKNRIYKLHNSICTPEAIEKTLKSHNIKINWHLRRIYRTRSNIIHSGNYPSYTSILIENLHNYVDLFLKRIINLSKAGKIRTIEQGILDTQISLEFQMSLLEKHKGEILSELNFKEAILGEKIM